MMQRTVPLVVLIASVLLSLVHGGKAEEVIIYSTPCNVCQGSQLEVYRTEKAHADALPKWDLNKQRMAPPLSAEEAIRLAAEHFRNTSKNFIGSMTGEVRFASYPQVEGRNALYGTPIYFVRLYGIFAAPDYPHLERHFVVLPDKTVLDPKLEPVPAKQK